MIVRPDLPEALQPSVRLALPQMQPSALGDALLPGEAPVDMEFGIFDDIIAKDLEADIPHPDIVEGDARSVRGILGKSPS